MISFINTALQALVALWSQQKYLNYQYLCYGNMFQLADFKESHRFAWFSARGGRIKAVETVYVKIKSKIESFFCCPFKNLNDLPQCVILLYQLDSYEFVRKQLCFQTKKHFYLRPLHWIVFFLIFYKNRWRLNFRKLVDCVHRNIKMALVALASFVIRDMAHRWREQLRIFNDVTIDI